MLTRKGWRAFTHSTLFLCLAACGETKAPSDAGPDRDAGQAPDIGYLEGPIGALRLELATDPSGLSDAVGGGTDIPGGGEPRKGEADWYAPGVVLTDVDGDGWLDIFFPRYDNTERAFRENKLFRNTGGARFVDWTERAGVSSFENSAAAVAGDVDGDGDVDLFVGNDMAASQLLINDGTGRFTDEASARGLTEAWRVFNANFVDFDQDGRLDIYIGTWNDAGPRGHFGGQDSHISPNVLLRQTPDGRFEDVTSSAGVECHGRSTLASAFFDADADGLLDLYVVNDFFDDCFYRGIGGGQFEEVTLAWGAGTHATTGMGITVADPDRDGDLDVFVADDIAFADGSPGNVFYRNDGDGFTSMAPELGLGGRFTWGTRFADFDNDGWTDLFGVTILGQGPFQLWQNKGDLEFEEIGAAALPDLRDARGAAVGDLDRDGRLDVVVALRREPLALFLNRTENPGHFLRIRPIARGSALGSRVFLEHEGVRRIETIVSGDSYRSSSEPVAHFGVGRARTLERVEVVFPSGETVVLEDVAANQELRVDEP